MGHEQNNDRSRPLLVVDDSPDDVFFLKRAFRGIGFAPAMVHLLDGLEAQAYLLRQGIYSHLASQPLPRLILSDINMPACSGLELLHWLRGHPRLPHIPVAVWSSSDHEQDLRYATQHGAMNYLLKPSNLSGFAQIARMLEQIWTLDTVE